MTKERQRNGKFEGLYDPKAVADLSEDQLAGHVSEKGYTRHHGRRLQRQAGCDPTGRQEGIQVRARHTGPVCTYGNIKFRLTQQFFYRSPVFL